MRRGIDVSMFVDVDILKYSPDFVIIRAGEGVLYQDAKAKHYAKICSEHGIPYGLYWVLDFDSGTPKQHFQSLIKVIADLPWRVTMGIWADVETPSAYDNVAISEFCEMVEDAGYYAGIYSGIMNIRTGKVGCERYDKWAAYYGPDSGSLDSFTTDEIDIIKDHASLWQYASGSGTEPDLDISFIDDLRVFDPRSSFDQPGAGGASPCPPAESPADLIGECLEILETLKNKLNKLKGDLS